MKDGALQFDIDLGGQNFSSGITRRRRRSPGEGKLNDNQWHSFSVHVRDGKLEVVLDGKVVFKKKLSPKTLEALNKGSNFF